MTNEERKVLKEIKLDLQALHVRTGFSSVLDILNRVNILLIGIGEDVEM